MRNIGVVGVGKWGANLARNFTELGALRGTYDMKKRCTYSSLSEMLQDAGIEGVAIATPSWTHYEVAKQCLEADKHVLLEKPMCSSVAQGEELAAIAKEHNLVLLVGHVLRYHDAFLDLAKKVREGLLGEVRYIASTRLNDGRVRVEEDVLWSFAPHDISLMMEIVGDRPGSLTAVGGDYINHKVADVSLTSLEFFGDVKGHIFVSWLWPHREQKFVVLGSEGNAVFEGNRLTITTNTLNETIEFKTEPLRAECQAFLEAMKFGGPMWFPDAREGIEVLRVLGAATDSMNRRGERIWL